jgi:mannose-6-phosphate isomerase-like protein (cupin superfamily)
MEATTTTAITPVPVVLTAEVIEALPEVPLAESVPGVTHRVLWRDGTSMAGVMTVAAGHRLGLHAHRRNHHHIWVVEGEAEILGAKVGPGGYVHVPAGVDHDLDATATGGCTAFYLYLLPGA